MILFLSALCLAGAALINLAPVIGALSGAQLERLYGLEIADPNLEILLRHRAVLFGVLGGAMLAGAVFSAWFWPALALGVISMAAYAAIALGVGGANEKLAFVLTMDWIGLGFAAAAASLRIAATLAR